MKTKTKLFHRKTNGTVKVWECWIDGRWVCSRWGVDGGKMSSTKERPKINHNWNEDEDIAVERMYLKKVQQKKKKGYVESLFDLVADIKVDDKTFNFDRLSKSFAPAKPIKKINIEEIKKWADLGLLFIQRKRDGMRHYLVSDSKARIKIYSSGKVDVSEHLQPLIRHLTLPPCTILDCELVVTEPGKTRRDGFLIVSSIARSLAERAQQQIKLTINMGAKVQLMAFDLLWENGVPTYRYTYENRYRLLARVVMAANKDIGGDEDGDPPLVRMPLVAISPTRLATLAEALDRVKKFKWEGLVLWRKDQATVVQVNGTPKRVNCWKLKLVGEEDVVATSYELGKGKNRNVVGKFRIALYNVSGRPIAGGTIRVRDFPPELKPMGKCGTGLDDKTRKAALKWTYPCVIQIEYDSKSDKGFRFPVFIRHRPDKKPSECVG